jgi:cephalosporin hydroxylase
MSKRISMIRGSIMALETIEQVQAEGKRGALVCLDSNHIQERVLVGLGAGARLT